MGHRRKLWHNQTEWMRDAGPSRSALPQVIALFVFLGDYLAWGMMNYWICCLNILFWKLPLQKLLSLLPSSLVKKVPKSTTTAVATPHQKK